MSDPFIYKILAVISAAIWGLFLIRYTLRLIGAQFWADRERAEFAWALLILGTSMVLYSVATILRQFLGLDYFARDGIRIVASCGLSFTGFVFHRVISRWPNR